MAIRRRARQATATSSPPGGDGRALFDAYVGPAMAGVHRLCLGILRDEDDAWDATQTTFEKILGRLGDYRDGNFDAWVKRIAYTTAIDLLRARRPTRSLDDADVVADAALGPDDLALLTDQMERVWDVLPRLSFDQQAVIQLKLLELSGAEIAESLNRTRDSVNMTYSRALKRLRDLLGPESGAKGGRP